MPGGECEVTRGCRSLGCPNRSCGRKSPGTAGRAGPERPLWSPPPHQFQSPDSLIFPSGNLPPSSPPPGSPHGLDTDLVPSVVLPRSQILRLSGLSCVHPGVGNIFEASLPNPCGLPFLSVRKSFPPSPSSFLPGSEGVSQLQPPLRAPHLCRSQLPGACGQS